MVQMGYKRQSRSIRVGAGSCCKYVPPPIHRHVEPSLFASGLYIVGAAMFVV